MDLKSFIERFNLQEKVIDRIKLTNEDHVNVIRNLHSFLLS